MDKLSSLSLPAAVKLIQRVLRNLNVPFTGEPLNGLQIMGILESRSIDFENIIVLSMNEGKWPKRSSAPSYIPFNLRNAFGMPTNDHQDSIFTYYFYRLLQRANQVHLVYSTATEGMQSGEKSRYLYQLELLEGKTLKHQHISFPVTIHQPQSIEIPKNDFVRSKLNEYLTPGKRTLSPSALNIYIDCSLRFYFKYIASLKEPEELRETVDPLSFGNILHATIDNIYRDSLGKELNASQIDKFLTNQPMLKEQLRLAYGSEYLKKSSEIKDEEIDALVFDILLKYINQILSYDKSLAPLEMVSLEDRYVSAVPIRINQKMLHVHLAGKIDRIDRHIGRIRVIDYKTGVAVNRIQGMENLFQQDEKNRNKAALQTLLYSFLYRQNYTHDLPIVPALYLIREINKPGFDYRLFIQPPRKERVFIDDFSNVQEDFEDYLKETLIKLFSEDVPFRQTANEDMCRNCPYVSICERD